MIKPGLVSITFRELSCEQIVQAVSDASLTGIEWGGDVHVPHGDTKQAAFARELTQDAGLECAAYGSYYRVGVSEDEGLTFQSVLDTAMELGTKDIRVWAGNRSSKEAEESFRRHVENESRRIANLAWAHGIRISYEYHGNTLTDTNESAEDLLRCVSHPGVHTYWQPPNGQSDKYCLKGLRNILPRLTNLHVFHWVAKDDEIDRRPLKEGKGRWGKFIDQVKSCSQDHYALIEFVRDGKLEQFQEDAQLLRSLAEATNQDA